MLDKSEPAFTTQKNKSELLSPTIGNSEPIRFLNHELAGTGSMLDIFSG
jgi:hypothetical protein